GTIFDALVHQKTRLEADGSDVAGNRARGDEVGVGREPHLACGERLAKLGLIDVTVARKYDRNDLSSLVAKEESLEERASGLPERRLECIDALSSRSRDLSASRDAVRARRSPCHVSRRLFHVRAVIAIRADSDPVFPDLGQHLELMRDVTAHRPGVRLDANSIEPQPFEGVLVRTELRRVALLQSGLVDVEAVRVLHHELADTEKPRARSRLVATFRLEVIDDLRHLLVALDFLHRMEMHEFLVRVAHHELTAVVVFRAECDGLEHVPPAGLLPQLRGSEDGHLHLLRADPILFLADDLLDLLLHPEPER